MLSSVTAKHIRARRIVASRRTVRAANGDANKTAQLLLTGINGTWINFQRDDARFQDASGQDAALTDGDPIGLCFDTKNGMPALGAALTLLANSATKSADGTATTNILATDSIALKYVRVQFTATGVVGSFTVSSTTGTGVTISADGVYDVVLVVGAAGGFIQIEGLTTSRYAVTGISIKQLYGNHAFQQTTTARPVLQSAPKRAGFDNADDQFYVHFDSAISGTWMQASAAGVLVGEVLIPAGEVAFQAAPQYMNPNNITQLFIADKTLTANEKIKMRNAMVEAGSLGNFATATDFVGVFYPNSTLTAVDFSGLDTSNVTSMYAMLLGCSSLVSVDFSGLDTSNVTSMESLLGSCSSLVSVDFSGLDFSSVTMMMGFATNASSLENITVGSAFSNSPCVNYGSAFFSCRLNVASVDAILASINAAGTFGGALGFEGPTNAIPTGGAANADVVALRARYWEINNDRGW